MLTVCPECKEKLHEGQHKFADGFYTIKYCKQCGFREEKPENIKKVKINPC
ncbi:MAG: hypothetical protein Q7R76_06710 [Candidatus Woesearchaeota archaeon]|nr:hypothetical protein [Candidatus Woesearchaeota archaeon]